jgi:hypothetical protein
MKRAEPSSSASFVKIGSAYKAERFERRCADGSYSARLPRCDRDAERLQRSLLGEAPWWLTAFAPAPRVFDDSATLQAALLNKEL